MRLEPLASGYVQHFMSLVQMNKVHNSHVNYEFSLLIMLIGHFDNEYLDNSGSFRYLHSPIFSDFFTNHVKNFRRRLNAILLKRSNFR